MASIAVFLVYYILCITFARALWPLPVEISQGTRFVLLDPEVAVICNDPQPLFYWIRKLQAILLTTEDRAIPATDRCSHYHVSHAIRRFTDDVMQHAFVPWKFFPKGHLIQPEFGGGSPVVKRIQIAFDQLDFSKDQEAYELSITEQGSVSIRINHALGATRALNSLTQLFYRQSEDAEMRYLWNAPLRVGDYPRFKHRGLNLDISRNIITPNDVKRTLDAMAFNKLNRLHIHATDAQSWPLEIPSLPELATAAYHPSQIWSTSDLHEIQAFGAERAVEVILEIDMPGHTAAVVESYPELITSFNRKPWQKYSAQPPSGQLKLANPEVAEFVETLLNDLLPRVGPFSALFHLGGDEIAAEAYDMTAAEVKPYLQEFLDHAISFVHSHGLSPVVWDELVLSYNLTLPPDTIVQAWRSKASGMSSSLARVVERGYKAIFGDYNHWYLDCGFGGWLDPDPQNPDSPVKRPFLDYCGPYHNWREVYSYDPLAGVPVDRQHLVVGGEASMWSEQTDSLSLDNNLWPRLSAAAGMLWQGTGNVSENVTRSLAEMREWLVSKGVAARPVQVTWCLMNRGNCVL